MSLIYQCPQCSTSLRSETPLRARCSRCNVPMEEVARETWLFKCTSCDFTNTGPVAQVTPCPLCDGSLYPSRIV